MKTLLMAISIFVVGCASEPLTEQQIYDRENAILIEHDKIRTNYKLCWDQGMSYLSNQRDPTFRRLKTRGDKVIYIPRHATALDYVCVNGQDAIEELRRAGF